MCIHTHMHTHTCTHAYKEAFKPSATQPLPQIQVCCSWADLDSRWSRLKPEAQGPNLVVLLADRVTLRKYFDLSGPPLLICKYRYHHSLQRVAGEVTWTGDVAPPPGRVSARARPYPLFPTHPQSNFSFFLESSHRQLSFKGTRSNTYWILITCSRGVYPLFHLKCHVMHTKQQWREVIWISRDKLFLKLTFHNIRESSN